MKYTFVKQELTCRITSPDDANFVKDFSGPVEISKLSDEEILISREGFYLELKVSDIDAIGGNPPAGNIPAIIDQLNYVIPIVAGDPNAGRAVAKTRDEWLDARGADELPKGLWIMISDATNAAPLGILAFCASENKFSAEAFGGFLNADFSGYGDYSGVQGVTSHAFTTFGGIWSPSKEGTILNEIGAVCIYNNEHYQVIDNNALNSSPPPNNNSAYHLLNKSTQAADGTALGYIPVWDPVIYDISGDQVSWRMNANGWRVNLTSIPLVDWGNSNIKIVRMTDAGSQVNASNITGDTSVIDDGLASVVNVSKNAGILFCHIKGKENGITADGNTGELNLFSSGKGIVVSGSSNSGTVMASLFDIAQLTFNNNTGNIRSWHRDQSVSEFSGNHGDIINAEISGEINLTIDLSNTFSHSACKYSRSGTFEFPNDQSFLNKSLDAQGSNFEIVISDASSSTLALPNWAGFIWINDSSIGIEIDTFTQSPKLPELTVMLGLDSSGCVLNNGSGLYNKSLSNNALVVVLMDFAKYMSVPAFGENGPSSYWVQTAFTSFD